MHILNGMQTRGVTVSILMMIQLFFITPISYLLSLWAFMGNYIDPVVTNYSTVCTRVVPKVKSNSFLHANWE